MAYYNAHRAAQATQLIPKMMADGLGPSHSIVLIVLGSMMTYPIKGVHRNQNLIVDSCFPTIDRLAEKTGLSVSTVCRSLKGLIEKGYITTEKRPGTVLRGGQYKGAWEGNRYRLVAAVWDTVETTLKHGSPVTAAPATPSIVTPIRSAAEEAQLEAEIEADFAPPTPVPAPPVAKKEDSTAPILALLNSTFGVHETYGHDDAAQIMNSGVNKCIKLAGSAEKAFEVLTWICTDKSSAGIRIKTLQQAKKLGGFIGAAFEDWHGEYLAHVNDGFFAAYWGETCKVDSLSVSSTFDKSNMHLLVPFKKWLPKTLGDRLVSMIEVKDADDETGESLTLEVSLADDEQETDEGGPTSRPGILYSYPPEVDYDEREADYVEPAFAG